jgi:hypothetical protein
MSVNFVDIDSFFGGIDLMSVMVFLLIFAVIFAILQKTRLMGDEKKNINVIISLVIALSAVLPHFSPSAARFDIVPIISEALPGVSIVLVAIVMMMILIGLFAHDRLYFGLTAPGWIAFLSFIVILVIFGSAANWWVPGFNTWISDMFGEGALRVVIMILIFGIIIAFITSEPNKDKKLGAMDGIGFHFDKLFGNGKK